jgi:hypothetical protein
VALNQELTTRTALTTGQNQTHTDRRQVIAIVIVAET